MFESVHVDVSFRYDLCITFVACGALRGALLHLRGVRNAYYVRTLCQGGVPSSRGYFTALWPDGGGTVILGVLLYHELW